MTSARASVASPTELNRICSGRIIASTSPSGVGRAELELAERARDAAAAGDARKQDGLADEAREFGVDRLPVKNFRRGDLSETPVARTATWRPVERASA